MRKIYEGWKKIAEKIGNFQATIIFSILYFIFLTPLGLGSCFKDFLRVRKKVGWEKVEDNVSTLEKLQKQ